MEPTPTLLHGNLNLTIFEARHLPNMDLFAERLRLCFSSCGFKFSMAATTTTSKTTPIGSADGSNKSRHKSSISSSRPGNSITSDPYVTVVLAGATVARTVIVPNDQSPVWNQHFVVPLAHLDTKVEFVVKDNDFFGAQTVGSVSIPTSHIAKGELIEDWFPITMRSGPPMIPAPSLLLKMQFIHVDKIPKKFGVDMAYFKERSNCKVTLYQDAHVRDAELLPGIEIDGGRMYQQEKCWEDICHAIVDAHKLIYIAGWSINDKVRLVREPTRRLPKRVEGLTLGELLKYKSAEGVRVLLLVWDDKTSHDKYLFKTGGLMQTHDEDTKKFFKHSSVICVLAPRYASSEISWVKQQVVGTYYTHHQKCLLIDTPAHGINRKITAFLGGLDLSDGRYDTPQHRLFRDLGTVFSNDFHNPTFPVSYEGPRQPWHDLHCKIDGPAAYDVLKNFEQRWRKGTRFWNFWRFKNSSRWRDDALLNLERISYILDPLSITYDESLDREEGSAKWNVQIFRSIDSGSVKGFPENVHKAKEQNLIFRKNLVTDKSIHAAYVNAIRAAEHFIYVENQYFIGSSFGWPSYSSAEADNLIPMEIALKVASKIRARERFAVYIIIPMWPEGSPNSPAVQEILSWQNQTMRMMYKIVGQELRSMNMEEAHPHEYLNFYCLGNRELLNGDIEQNSSQVPPRKYRRFMIYVHSKGMIVDDEFVLLGSANINQRSMDGSRDTEIAMGAHQPHHTWAAKKCHPRGQVYGYRMSLWLEHLGCIKDEFKEPCSLECVNLVNRIADENWIRYTTEEIIPLKGHLLKYPIQVDSNGGVSARPGHDHFPDVGGKVSGDPGPLPDNLTM